MPTQSIILKSLPIDQLVRGEFQPRDHFDPQALTELSQSIQANGLLQPILVRPLALDQYEIIAGERRWRATQMAGIEYINCIVANYDDIKAAEAAAAENLNRMDLNPIEEARAYLRLIDNFSYSHEEIAAALGKSRTKITNCLRLLSLTPTIQDMLKQGLLHEGHGKTLAGLPPELQHQMAQNCLQKSWSVRTLEKAIKQIQQKPSASSHIDPDLQQLEQNLAAHIGAPVHLQYANGKGRLAIDFHSLEILEGLLDKLQFQHRDQDFTKS